MKTYKNRFQTWLQNSITKPPFPNSQKIIVKPSKATHLQTYVNSRVLNPQFLKSLLKHQFTNLCKFTEFEICCFINIRLTVLRIQIHIWIQIWNRRLKIIFESRVLDSGFKSRFEIVDLKLFLRLSIQNSFFWKY